MSKVIDVNNKDLKYQGISDARLYFLLEKAKRQLLDETEYVEAKVEK